FRACGGYPAIPLREDYGLWLRMIAGGFRLANLPDVLVRARLGADFYGRRSGAGTLASEWALYRLRLEAHGADRGRAFAAFAARSLALAAEPPARLIYESVLRR
ncbi:MAG: hypothetical protein ABI376_00275, partial [Caulobacteraceae bacterium]